MTAFVVIIIISNVMEGEPRRRESRGQWECACVPDGVIACPAWVVTPRTGAARSRVTREVVSR